MNRLRELDRYPKILLIALLVMTVVFAGVYGVMTSRVGYLHNGEIFVPRQENSLTLYETTVDDQPCVFTVTADTVKLVWGQKTYGPYTLREDPTAVPEDISFPMTGIEILDGQRVYFRGGVTDEATDFWLLSEDGKNEFLMSYTLSDGVEYDMNGNPIDPMKPSPYQIISLLRGPELTHKGDWTVFLISLFCAAATAISILFADELFYLSICFRVENAETAEPSDWYIACRNFSWLLLTIFTGAAFFMGLQ